MGDPGVGRLLQAKPFPVRCGPIRLDADAECFRVPVGYQMGIDGALKVQITDELSARGNVAWGRCKGNGLQSGNYLLDTKEITDINTAGGVFCDHSQTITSSAVVAYRFPFNTTVSGQMLSGSGLRTSDSEDAFTNSSHFESWTIYNASITHV